MSFDSQLLHLLTIERETSGTPDEYNQPSRTWATLSEVPGLVQPKTAREIAQLNQAGPSLSTFSIYLRPTDIESSDRVRVADAGVAGTYEIDGVLNQAGRSHHLKLDAHRVDV